MHFIDFHVQPFQSSNKYPYNTCFLTSKKSYHLPLHQEDMANSSGYDTYYLTLQIITLLMLNMFQIQSHLKFFLSLPPSLPILLIIPNTSSLFVSLHIPTHHSSSLLSPSHAPSLKFNADLYIFFTVLKIYAIYIFQNNSIIMEDFVPFYV